MEDKYNEVKKINIYREKVGIDDTDRPPLLIKNKTSDQEDFEAVNKWSQFIFHMSSVEDLPSILEKGLLVEKSRRGEQIYFQKGALHSQIPYLSLRSEVSLPHT